MQVFVVALFVVVLTGSNADVPQLEDGASVNALHAATWVSLRCALLREGGHAQKGAACAAPFVSSPGEGTNGTKGRAGLPGIGGGFDYNGTRGMVWADGTGGSYKAKFVKMYRNCTGIMAIFLYIKFTIRSAK